MTIQLSPLRRAALAAGLLLALAGCAAVKPQQPEASVPRSQSVADADRKLAVVARERAQAEAAYAASEQLCYAKFFVNNCLDEAREKRRLTLAGLRAIEIEAEHFKRQAKVDQRDRELAKAEQDYQAEQAKLAAQPRSAPRVEPEQTAPKTAPVAHDRAAEQAAKTKRLEEKDKAGAAKRAANVAAFEKRKRDSEQRQRAIVEKKKKAVKEEEGR
jgi:hypothetical protein